MAQRYEMITMIGEGAYGGVFKARRKCNNEIVAIKKFKDNTDKNSNRDIKRTVFREIKMLRQLQNFEHVVQLQDQYKRRGRIHLVFEFIDRSLLNLLEANPAGLSDRIVNTLLVQLLNAVEWCHQNNIIHRDIKPENLLVDSASNNLKLCDFGFARNMQKDDEEPVTQYVATRWYRAPELLVGTNRHTTAVDIWPIGCIWVEMCSSEPLFPGDSEIDQIYIIQEGLGHPLPQTLLSLFKTNAKYAGLSLPQPELYSKDTTSSLNKRIRKQHQVSYQYFQTDNRLVLLSEMLKLDPDSRVSISDAIKFIETSGKSFIDDEEIGQKSIKVNKLRVKKSLTKLSQNYEKTQNYDKNYDTKNYDMYEIKNYETKNYESKNFESINYEKQEKLMKICDSSQTNILTAKSKFKTNSKQNQPSTKTQSNSKLNQHKKLYKARKSSSGHNIETSSTLKLPKMSTKCTNKNIVGNGLLLDLLETEEIFEDAFEDKLQQPGAKHFLKRKLD